MRDARTGAEGRPVSPIPIRLQDLPPHVRAKFARSASRPSAKRGSPEHEAQAGFFSWLAAVEAHPMTPPHVALAAFLTYAVPNGGHRDPRTAARLKAEGVKRGVPDIQCDYPVRHADTPQGERAAFHGWRCEVKIKPNRLSPEQERRLAELAGLGYAVAVARHAEVTATTDQIVSSWCRYVGWEPVAALRMGAPSGP